VRIPYGSPMKILKALLAFVLLSVGIYAATIGLAWDQNTETNISNYQIYRSLNGASPPVKVGTVPYPNTSISNVLVDFGTNIFYATAVDSNGLESGFSSPVTFITNAPPVGNPPIITVQPATQTVYAPSAVLFSVSLTNNATMPVFYQWYRNFAMVPNQTNASYLIPFTTTNDSGTYFANVWNSVKTNISSVAMLTVKVYDKPVPVDVTGATVGGITNNVWTNVSVVFNDKINTNVNYYYVSAQTTNNTQVVSPIAVTKSPATFVSLNVQDIVFSVVAVNQGGTSPVGKTFTLSSRPPAAVANFRVQ
jgi:hypothetical protein